MDGEGLIDWSLLPSTTKQPTSLFILDAPNSIDHSSRQNGSSAIAGNVLRGTERVAWLAVLLLVSWIVKRRWRSELLFGNLFRIPMVAVPWCPRQSRVAEECPQVL